VVGAPLVQPHQLEQGLVRPAEQAPGAGVLAAVEQVTTKEHEVEQIKH
jgi:hypothetical protein